MILLPTNSPRTGSDEPVHYVYMEPFTRPTGRPPRSTIVTTSTTTHLLTELRSVKQMFTTLPSVVHNVKPGSNRVLSSTPFTKPADHRLDRVTSNVPSERYMYKHLLAQAALDSPCNRPRNIRIKTMDKVTIVIDDDDDDRYHSETESKRTLKHCEISPIHSVKELDAPRSSTVATTSESECSKTFDHIDCVPSETCLLFLSVLLFDLVDAVAKLESANHIDSDADREAQSWLRACEQTPYLSDTWLANLTTNFQRKTEQRERERQLVEAKVQYWERQRMLTNQRRMEHLEQRLACLLLTPPVLADPYLVPQPIPIELPYQPRKVASIVPTLPELTDSQLAQVESVLRGGPPDAVIVENFHLSVNRRELLTLTGTNWLSDMIINFYMQLLYHRSQTQRTSSSRSLPRIAVLSTFFYAKLTSSTGGGYAGVRRWSRQLHLLDQDLILVPIHDRGMHWCLACIDLKAKSITYYDSMGSPNHKCLKTLMSYLQSECNDKKGHPLPDPDSWKLINTEDTVPQQMNGSDCGVFLCTFGEFLSRNAQFTFSQHDMPGIRKRMLFEIITQQLLTTGFQVKVN
ncbi:sentrin-specific protease 1 [Paragonimus westermani]|uniref:Sentrin-specific protease 1 n=1 Tax=Paragonimus westermani TaxID=34504 RepID=A0A5J4NWY6_9TREM|nr:sentrin-specific protease 1 [Paragonimus westermani]